MAEAVQEASLLEESKMEDTLNTNNNGQDTSLVKDTSEVQETAVRRRDLVTPGAAGQRERTLSNAREE